MHLEENNQVDRPMLPPLFLSALGVWVSCAATYIALQYADYRIDACIFAVGCCMAGVAFVLYNRKKIAFSFTAVALGVSLGILAGSSAAASMHITQENLAEGARATYTFQIVEDIHDSLYGSFAKARAYNAEGKSFLVRVNFSGDVLVSCWDVFDATCSIKMPSQSSAQYYWSQGCVGSVSVYTPGNHHAAGPLGVLTAIRNKGIDVFGAETDGALFMRSIIFGERTSLFQSSFYSRVKQAGLAHLVAVSGAHFSILIASLGLFLSILHCSKRFIAMFQILFGLCFVVLVGMPYSALRAFLMALSALLALFGGRKPYALNGLSVCVIVFILLKPQVSISVSFLLSALSTAGIVIFATFFASWFSKLFGNRCKHLCTYLGMTCAALLFTVPVSTALFNQYSLIAPLSNVIAVPVFSFLCIAGFVSAVLSVTFSWCSLPAAFTVYCANHFCDVVSLLASFPYSAIATNVNAWIIAAVSIALVGALYYWWPSPSRLFVGVGIFAYGMLVALSILVLPGIHGTEIIMLDVGQGDAFVLRSGSKAVLVDTGNNDAKVLKGLARHHIRFLDAVFITHPDDDHCGSLETILGFCEVGRVVVAKDLLTCSCKNCSSLRRVAQSVNLVGVCAGDVVEWGSFRALILSPEHFIDEGGNDDSLVMSVHVDANNDAVIDSTALFCGDAEKEVLEKLQRKGALMPVDIFKVGHHGSKGSCTKELLQYLCPKIALVSAGASNRYGHPAQETVDVISGEGIGLYRTDILGDVVCIIEPNTVRIQSLR